MIIVIRSELWCRDLAVRSLRTPGILSIGPLTLIGSLNHQGTGRRGRSYGYVTSHGPRRTHFVFLIIVFLIHARFELYRHHYAIQQTSYSLRMSTTARMQSPAFIVSNALFISPNTLRWVMNSSTFSAPLR